MKDEKGQPEKYQENDGERIGQYLLHAGTKIKNRLSEAVFYSLSKEGLTKFVKGLYEVFSDHLGRPAFDMVALNHVHQFSVPEKGHARG